MGMDGTVNVNFDNENMGQVLKALDGLMVGPVCDLSSVYVPPIARRILEINIICLWSHKMTIYQSI